MSTSAVSPAATSLAVHVQELLHRARAAAAPLASATTAAKNGFLRRVAEELQQQAPAILAANALDVQAAIAAGRSAALVDRLRLTEAGLGQLAAAVRDIAGQADPVGQTTSGAIQPSGIEVRKVRIPLGVIAMIYEARPGVTIDAAALCVKAGNAVILRGGSEAQHSNTVLVGLLQEALLFSGLPVHAVQAPAYTDREVVDLLVADPHGLDLVIPRGGVALIEAVSRASRVPVIQHYQGICHVYVAATADLDAAQAIVVNAKCQRPGVCNAMEALLIDAAIAPQAVPQLLGALTASGTEVRACPQTLALWQQAGQSAGAGAVVPAQPADYGQEFLELRCLVAVVDGLDAALAHIRQYGSRHTEAILSQDLAQTTRFVREVDASCVIVNASTRFNDGGCLGLGAEIGISTTKLHAYGPMGLGALTAEKFVVFGQGQVRS